MSSFRSYSLQARKKIYDQYTANHPDSIALIIEVHKNSKLTVNTYFKLMAKKHFTVRTVTQSLYNKVKHQSKVLASDPSLSIFLFCQNKLVNSNEQLSDLIEYRDKDDNFLYLTMAETPTF